MVLDLCECDLVPSHAGERPALIEDLPEDDSECIDVSFECQAPL